MTSPGFIDDVALFHLELPSFFVQIRNPKGEISKQILLVTVLQSAGRVLVHVDSFRFTACFEIKYLVYIYYEDYRWFSVIHTIVSFTVLERNTNIS